MICINEKNIYKERWLFLSRVWQWKNFFPKEVDWNTKVWRYFPKMNKLIKKDHRVREVYISAVVWFRHGTINEIILSTLKLFKICAKFPITWYKIKAPIRKTFSQQSTQYRKFVRRVWYLIKMTMFALETYRFPLTIIFHQCYQCHPYFFSFDSKEPLLIYFLERWACQFFAAFEKTLTRLRKAIKLKWNIQM